MIFIAHRGNVNGPDSKHENSPMRLINTIAAGYHVETDVWYLDKRLYTGHPDHSLYPIYMDFLYNDHIWCHAKTNETLNFLVHNKQIHCFWHEGKDRTTLTSHNFIWSLDELPYDDSAVWVNVDGKPSMEFGMYGICSNYVKPMKKAYEAWLS
jgi:hypothetical protein